MNLNHPQFKEGVAELLDISVEELTSDYIIDWDSMAIVGTIALADDLFGIVLDGPKIASCNTIEDLKRLIADGR